MNFSSEKKSKWKSKKITNLLLSKYEFCKLSQAPRSDYSPLACISMWAMYAFEKFHACVYDVLRCAHEPKAFVLFSIASVALKKEEKKISESAWFSDLPLLKSTMPHSHTHTQHLKILSTLSHTYEREFVCKSLSKTRLVCVSVSLYSIQFA